MYVTMWNQLKHIGSHCVITRVWQQHTLFRNYARLWRCVSSRLRELWTFSNHSRRTHDSPDSFASSSPVNGNGLRERPPWRILFFGTDEFAVESLKALTLSRDSSPKTAVDTLEVVTLPAVLSKELPVRRFASQNELPIHDWPHIGPCEQFDVGVVVSFGCLLPEDLILKFPYGILNVHPSLLPRWRGPAPVFHTVLNGDTETGVTIMQIRPKRFDVGPILIQDKCLVQPHCTAQELGATLAKMGAKMLISTLENLPERIQNKKEQSKQGSTFAPKISVDMSWVNWEDQSCDQIGRLFQAIGSRISLRTLWIRHTIKLLDFVGKNEIPVVSESERQRKPTPGSLLYHKESNTLLVCCKDGWVGFKAVKLKKRLSAADFYNGYLHQYFLRKSERQQSECLFQTYKPEPKDVKKRKLHQQV
ncbi:methionyl-tRNA formyltransferase, mitochondrial-like isoform X2 [Acipenser oxyrinchus oxyrinchus]|uniref:Methionyl-tRNA formyltransferase, mitochondrial n=1 Tax=Acipenser oxyrinchus oxyrinchus TaxID=40147 RepID=A0AAD8D1P0_ACIOX|nr:methionyl-tRNA formyltransferase, mitochondrial-like isoform X2 [Acipenser oxyrinchus oxyrinchus]